MLESIRPRSRKKVAWGRARRIRLFVIGGCTVALLAYLFDPDRGKSRRSRLMSQTGGMIRTAKSGVGRTGRRAASDIAGLKGRMTSGDDVPPPNDPALVAKVESEVMGRYQHLSINVNAEYGIIAMRGEVPDEGTRSELEQAVRKVTGVVDVDNLLHLPGQPAPMK
ncbi:MAG: BON domain-containing protein [Actinomycetota bacterium]